MNTSHAGVAFALAAVAMIVAFCLTWVPAPWSERFKIAGLFLLAVGLLLTQ